MAANCIRHAKESEKEQERLQKWLDLMLLSLRLRVVDCMNTQEITSIHAHQRASIMCRLSVAFGHIGTEGARVSMQCKSSRCGQAVSTKEECATSSKNREAETCTAANAAGFGQLIPEHAGLGSRLFSSCPSCRRACQVVWGRVQGGSEPSFVPVGQIYNNRIRRERGRQRDERLNIITDSKRSSKLAAGSIRDFSGSPGR